METFTNFATFWGKKFSLAVAIRNQLDTECILLSRKAVSKFYDYINIRWFYVYLVKEISSLK